MEFKPTDLKYIRNVKRDDGHDWAYMDSEFDKEFNLNWSTRVPEDARIPHVGDVIIIYQRVNHMPSFADEVYLTHLVTPMDEELIDDFDINPNYRWARRVAVIAKANPRSAIPKIRKSAIQLNFTPVNQNHSYTIDKIKHNLDSTESLQKYLWQLFNEHFNPDYIKYLEETISEFNVSEEEFTFNAEEGGVKEECRNHKIRERNPGLTKRAKARAFRKGEGNILCECCQFNFLEFYGDIGLNFIECHHKYFVSDGLRSNSLDDLAMVCANCHRMLHKSYDGTNFYTVEEMKNQIESRKSLKLF